MKQCCFPSDSVGVNNDDEDDDVVVDDKIDISSLNLLPSLSMTELTKYIQVEKFKTHCDLLQSIANGFDTEYHQAKRSVECQDGYLERFMDVKNSEVQKRNRYTDIICFEDSRVIIKGGSCDYVNASNISIEGINEKYIAAQAPTSYAMENFWRMVWENNVGCVAMLTPWKEKGMSLGKDKIKADRYLPLKLEEKEQYGPFTITCVEVDEDQTKSHSLTIRKLLISKIDEEENNNKQQQQQQRTIGHVHFTDWPDFGSVEDCGDYLNLHYWIRKLIKKYADESNLHGPLIVHCSAGIGRTGTYIAIDSILNRMSKAFEVGENYPSPENRLEIDIANIVSQLRKQRPGMVFTREQYIMIYQVVHFILFGHSLGGNDDNKTSNRLRSINDNDIYRQNLRNT